MEQNTMNLESATNEAPQVATEAKDETNLQAWVKPTFERIRLNEALTGGNFSVTDATDGYS